MVCVAVNPECQLDRLSGAQENTQHTSGWSGDQRNVEHTSGCLWSYFLKPPHHEISDQSTDKTVILSRLWEAVKRECGH